MTRQLESGTQRVSRFEREGQGTVRVGGETIQVAHLPAGAGLSLAIQMKSHARPAERLMPARGAPGPEISQQIDHRDGAQQPGLLERKPAQGPELELELIDRAGVDGVVPAVVGSRSHLVYQQS